MDKWQKILKEYWGYDDFRGIQREIIESIGAGRDTLGLMPTGGGKSITFQVPAMAMEGVCIVITPLIALMKDQVQHLRERGIKASAIYSGMTRNEIITTLENSIFGGVKILYVSPERLSSELFLAKVKRIHISFITVDEAHCISQWGYDFRPAYLKIANIRRIFPDVPVLALTATATPVVVDDIVEKLELKGEDNVFRMSFERKNLAYIVRQTNDKYGELIHILNSVKGCSIIYVRSRRRTKEIAQLLNDNNIKATFFHAGLDNAVKDDRQKAWQSDEVRVIVATNAFGMGIDKPDVRLVIHIDCPDSIEAYFQEAGRAGRDGKKAYAVLLYNGSDRRKLSKRIADNFPEKDYIKKVYSQLAYFYQIGTGSGGGHTFEFDIDRFCHTYKHFPLMVHAALKILERAGYIHYETDPDASACVLFLLSRNELYRLENNSPHEERVITALLRCYGGLFTDYSYIDESLVAQQAGLTTQQTYLCLKALSTRRIIHFIPRRKTPYITYLVNRVEEERLIIPHEVYEVRKEQFSQRINAVQMYAENDNVCRSRQLLRYFGESRSTDCRQCDVCIEKSHDIASESHTAPARQQIVSLLKDGQPHAISELRKQNLPTAQLENALQYLLAEEVVVIDGGKVWLIQ